MAEPADGDVEALAAALLAKDAELVRFTKAVSHDLRGPLITARAFHGFLRADLAAGDAAKVASDLQHLGRSIARMERLLSQLVSWSRAGRFAKKCEHVPFGEVAREVVASLAEELSRRQIEVVIGEPTPNVRAGREQLADLLRQLVEDASSHRSAVDGPFVIEVGSRPSQAGHPVLTVTHTTATNLSEGAVEDPTGELEGESLAVTLARRIVEVYGGSIWVERKKAGRTIGFTLAPKRPA